MAISRPLARGDLQGRLLLVAISRPLASARGVLTSACWTARGDLQVRLLLVVFSRPVARLFVVISRPLARLLVAIPTPTCKGRSDTTASP